MRIQRQCEAFAYRMAMPVGDAYDFHYRDQPPDQTPTRPGPWYHASPQDLPVGTILDTSHKKNWPYADDYQPRNNWVWMDRSPSLVGHWAPNVYEVEPLDEGPHAYNGTGIDGFVSPRARIVRKVRPVGDEQRQANSRLAAVTQDMVDNLNTQFHDWWGQQNNSGGSADDLAQMDFMDEDRGPIGHWPNIENFLKEKYPAAHKGLGMGLEAEWSLDGHAKPYLTGPAAIKEHGYDPSEIAAGMLLLHNQSDPFRGDMAQQDQDRLNDIAQKRYKMQRAYDSRQTQPAAQPLVTAQWRKTAADLVKDYTDGLYNEFHDWAKDQDYVPVGFDRNDPRVLNPDYTKPMNGPLSYWDNIEGFLKDRYPAAFRGYRYGEENAADALDGNTLRMPAQYSPWPNRTYHPGYETGPEAIEKYGYDPRQVAAGFMYLHTWSHAQSAQNKWRGDKLPRDIDRLSDIFQKRQQMQDAYKSRSATYHFAMPWYHVSPHDLPEGTVLTPGGGRSLWDDVPYDLGGKKGQPEAEVNIPGPKISDYVWLDNNREVSDFRREQYQELHGHPAHQYEVDTDHEPEDFGGEYAVPQAVVKRRLSHRFAANEDLVRMIHFTSPEKADKIMQEQKFTPWAAKFPDATDEELYNFFTDYDHRDDPEFHSYGPSRLMVEVPRSALKPDSDMPWEKRNFMVHQRDLQGRPITRLASSRTAMLEVPE